MNILVIDDSEAAQIAFEQVLSHAGFVVTSALTANEGLKSIRKKTPDLIILDVQLPDLLGTQLCEMLKNDPATRYIPILMCTGHRAVAHGLNQGADDYLLKPCGGEEMVARVNALLRRVEMAEERAREKENLKHRQERAAKQQEAAAPRREKPAAAAVPPSGKIRQGLSFAWASLAYPIKPPSKHDKIPLASALTPLWLLCLFQTALRLVGPHAESGVSAALSGCAWSIGLWAATALLSISLLPGISWRDSGAKIARICAAAAAPLALRGLLALQYALLCDGVPAEFSASPLLLHVGPSTVAWLANFDLFALWSALIVAVGARRVGKLSIARAVVVGAGAWGLWILAQEAGRFAVWGP
jgi:CheY-like chemotaxis protein